MHAVLVQRCLGVARSGSAIPARAPSRSLIVGFTVGFRFAVWCGGVLGLGFFSGPYIIAGFGALGLQRRGLGIF